MGEAAPSGPIQRLFRGKFLNDSYRPKPFYD